jgi:hypothetical protein
VMLQSRKLLGSWPERRSWEMELASRSNRAAISSHIGSFPQETFHPNKHYLVSQKRTVRGFPGDHTFFGRRPGSVAPLLAREASLQVPSAS